VGELLVVVAIQAFVPGLYLPPLLKYVKFPSKPPHTIISVPLHTAVCDSRADGAVAVLVVIQVSVLGMYFAPVFNTLPLKPPHTIISVPLHTTV
jgi:hypothetical protein